MIVTDPGVNEAMSSTGNTLRFGLAHFGASSDSIASLNIFVSIRMV